MSDSHRLDPSIRHRAGHRAAERAKAKGRRRRRSRRAWVRGASARVSASAWLHHPPFRRRCRERPFRRRCRERRCRRRCRRPVAGAGAGVVAVSVSSSSSAVVSRLSGVVGTPRSSGDAELDSSPPPPAITAITTISDDRRGGRRDQAAAHVDGLLVRAAPVAAATGSHLACRLVVHVREGSSWRGFRGSQGRRGRDAAHGESARWTAAPPASACRRDPGRWCRSAARRRS